jgi:hypothetical protein
MTVSIWAIYNSPKDYPGKFVARRWELTTPTDEVIVADTLDEVRERLPLGLRCLDRHSGDDPVIVETWL